MKDKPPKTTRRGLLEAIVGAALAPKAVKAGPVCSSSMRKDLERANMYGECYTTGPIRTTMGLNQFIRINRSKGKG